MLLDVQIFLLLTGYGREHQIVSVLAVLLRPNRIEEGVLEGIFHRYSFVGVQGEQSFEQIVGIVVKIVSK